ncbi:arabinogalactan endo-1,4-beta-galactosidase [Grosmannia clavigera kw1407]|uniref:Arabinogalactan endo-beta-1,4-galactanase n=1 Tax=Grosmannia clavigera (strain kw1407 / UAMH 11150) TaxID=655863 RepID=F0X8S5_GROCL|nr:arabinogalactan endo-1,4-beta-galactosidase [Grosmannia clavigera kw1407]EFX05976.1 arabinogalactan endo-1,4-beta-galactosidase [Grosmannia clavigera kw1407]
MLSKLVCLLALGLSAVQAKLTYRGVDWSSVPVEEDSGLKYSTASGTTEAVEKIFASSGINTVRQRIWVNPSDKTYGLDYNVALAKRAVAAGLGVYLDLHFSDTWADPANQAIPSGWPTAIEDLAWEVYNYTLEVADTFEKAGIQPKIISIGNEITSGLLFPTGELSKNPYNTARLLHSASAGIKASTLSTQPQIMIHLDNGWNWETQKYWYTTVLGEGPLTLSDFDIMGVSYYPFYNSKATLASLKTSLTNMASTWGKDLVVAETDWPSSCPNPKYAFPSDTTSIPISPAGQATWIKDVAAIVAGVSKGLGLFYWEPAWVSNANLGSSCDYCCMFTTSGEAMSSLAAFSSI